MGNLVTVIIPSYNRAGLLPRILPTYIQENVAKIIVVDDASSDSTQDVLNKLKKEIPILTSIRQPKNMRQTAAKNAGIQQTDTEFIYFGDDDSILMPNSIPTLLQTLYDKDADIVGTKALYMFSQKDEENIADFIAKYDVAYTAANDIVDLNKLKANFTYSSNEPIAVPFTHASFLVRTSLAKQILFDENYIGNCYREETDFLLRANFLGAKIYYQLKAIQINLPRNIARGGAHSRAKYKWYLYSFKNNYYFLKKNYSALRQKYHLRRPLIIQQAVFMSLMVSYALKNILRKLFGA